MNDLMLALRSAADHATADRDPLPASLVLSRIHRRRTVRYASQGAVGLAAAGAAVVGGIQVAGRAPTPPATSSPTGLAEASAVRCGADLDAFAQPQGAPDVTLRLDAYEAAMVEPADGDIPITVDVRATPGSVVQAGASVTFALVRGRWVVGLPEAEWVDEAQGFVDNGGEPMLFRSTDVRFAACGPDGTAAGTLEPGAYGVVAFLLPDDPTDWPIPFRSNGVIVHLGDPTGAAGQRPYLDSLVISADGVGPVRLGEAPPTEGTAAVVERQEMGCVGLDDDGVARVGGRWAATYPARSTPYGTRSEPFGVGVEDGRVTRVEVVTDGLATEAGIQVGASLSDLRSAYPDLDFLGTTQASGEIPARDVWAVVDGDRMLAFEVATDAPALPQFVLEPGTVAAIVATLGTSVDGPAALGEVCVWQ